MSPFFPSLVALVLVFLSFLHLFSFSSSCLSFSCLAGLHLTYQPSVFLSFLHFVFLHVVILLQYSLPTFVISPLFHYFFVSSYSFCFPHLFFSPLSFLLLFFSSSPPSPLHLTFFPICSFLHFLFSSFSFIFFLLLPSSSFPLSFASLVGLRLEVLPSHISALCIFSFLIYFFPFILFRVLQYFLPFYVTFWTLFHYFFLSLYFFLPSSFLLSTFFFSFSLFLHILNPLLLSLLFISSFSPFFLSFSFYFPFSPSSSFFFILPPFLHLSRRFMSRSFTIPHFSTLYFFPPDKFFSQALYCLGFFNIFYPSS